MTLQMAFRNFTRNSRRFLLLGLAVAAGFFFVCTVQSLVAGLFHQINIRATRYYGGHIIVSRGKGSKNPASLAEQDRYIMDALSRSEIHPSRIKLKQNY